jgi:hypothetical protein
MSVAKTRRVEDRRQDEGVVDVYSLAWRIASVATRKWNDEVVVVSRTFLVDPLMDAILCSSLDMLISERHRNDTGEWFPTQLYRTVISVPPCGGDNHVVRGALCFLSLLETDQLARVGVIRDTVKANATWFWNDEVWQAAVEMRFIFGFYWRSMTPPINDAISTILPAPITNLILTYAQPTRSQCFRDWIRTKRGARVFHVRCAPFWDNWDGCGPPLPPLPLQQK